MVIAFGLFSVMAPAKKEREPSGTSHPESAEDAPASRLR